MPMNRKGRGFYIYKMQSIVDYFTNPAEFVDCLKLFNISWIGIKMADGEEPYNQLGGNDKIVKEYVEVARNAGLVVGGWHYVYPERPSIQGDRAMERYEKFKLQGGFWDINAEKEWVNVSGANRYAEVYLSKLHGGNFEIGLTTARFPYYWSGDPKFITRWMKHDKVSVGVPQLYWILSHNVEEQFERSFNEWRQYTDKPLLMLGSTYCAGAWCPTLDDLTTFRELCENQYHLPAYGLYALDWMARHPEKIEQWLEVFSDAAPPPPPPHPEPEPQPEDFVPYQATMKVNGMSIRNEPRWTPTTDPYGTRFGIGIRGQQVTVIGPKKNGYVPVIAHVWDNSLEPKQDN